MRPDHAGHAAQASASDPTGAPMAVSSAGGVTYTCPMHPEVVSDAPGKCPKCGMTLVRRDQKSM